jgi:5-methyltetrahydropteroyltriglutamate--homocysteine methyltransferase
VIGLECASNEGRDLKLLERFPTEKKIAIGVVDHTRTTVESPELVASIIRKALEHVPPERLVVTSDCGFGREGLSRRIAHYKSIALVLGTNIVREELGLEPAPVRAADPAYAFRED